MVVAPSVLSQGGFAPMSGRVEDVRKEVKRMYRILSLVLHPDKQDSEYVSWANEAFQVRIGCLYIIICRPNLMFSVLFTVLLDNLCAAGFVCQESANQGTTGCSSGDGNVQMPEDSWFEAQRTAQACQQTGPLGSAFEAHVPRDRRFVVPSLHAAQENLPLCDCEGGV